MNGYAQNYRPGRALKVLHFLEKVMEFDILGWIFRIGPEEEDEVDEEEMYRIMDEAGIDSFAYDYMDDEERIWVLEEAGLDPFDFGL